MSAAGLPVCLTRPPKLVLHPPPVSKSDIKSIPGIANTCRKTTKKQTKKGKNKSFSASSYCFTSLEWHNWKGRVSKICKPIKRMCIVTWNITPNQILC